MRYPRVLRSRDQLALFHPKTEVPPWNGFSAEMRVQTVRLLAQLLQQHRRHLLAQRLGREVRDE
jgi:hypothetical protein